MVAVRLSDVAENGEATRVTYGLLNLTHRRGHEEPEPLEPGRRERVRVRMNHVAQRFPAGHRLRLSISTSYFPLAWPPPEPARIAVRTGTSQLVLPERPPRGEDEALRPFEAPEAAAPVEVTQIEPGQSAWRVVRDLFDDVSTLEVIKDEGARRIEAIDWEVTTSAREVLHLPNSRLRIRPRRDALGPRLRRGDWSVRTETRTVLTSDRARFLVHAELDAYEGDARIFSQNYHFSIPRDHV